MRRSARRGIVMIAYTYYPWDPRVRREAETLARLGHRVEIVCARDENETARAEVGGVRVERLPLRIRRGSRFRYVYQYGTFMMMAVACLHRVSRPLPSAVHVHSLPDFLVFVALGARLLGIPVVLDLHDAMPEIFMARFPDRGGLALARAAEKLSCWLANRVIVTSETIRENLVARGIPSERLLIVYNSPDFSASPAPPREPELRPHDVLRLVYAGGVDKERDLTTYIRAVAALTKVRRVTLAIYGHGPEAYRQTLRDLIEELALGPIVSLGGVLPREEVLPHLAEAEVGVATYERNPLTEIILPSKAFEFVLLEKPLVLPNLRGMRRMFEGAALFYEPGNAPDLALQIDEAASGSSTVQAMLNRARRIGEDTRWEAQATKLAQAYETLVPPSKGNGA